MVRAAMEGGIPAVYDEKRCLLNQSLGDDYYTPNPSGFWEIGEEKFTDPDYMANLKDGHVYNIKLEGLKFLPDNCSVVLMVRDPVEIRSSFRALDGTELGDDFPGRYWEMIADARQNVQVHAEFLYPQLVKHPDLLDWLSWPIDRDRAKAVIKPEHYRHKAESIVC